MSIFILKLLKSQVLRFQNTYYPLPQYKGEANRLLSGTVSLIQQIINDKKTGKLKQQEQRQDKIYFALLLLLVVVSMLERTL